MKPVLVTDGGHGQNHGALGAVRALSEAGWTVHVTVSDTLSVAGRSRHCAARIPVPEVDNPGYAAAVRAMMDSGEYTAVLPASDAAMVALDLPGRQFVDKLFVSRRAGEVGMPTSRRREFINGFDLLEHAGGLDYPLVVKAVAKSETTSLNAWRADSPHDLLMVQEYPYTLCTEPWIEGKQHGISGVVWGGRLRAVMHQAYYRTWPRDCGVATASVSTEPDHNLEKRVEEFFGDWGGMFNMQLIEGYLHDVNPRIYGSVLMPARAGVNFPDIVCRLSLGESVAPDRPLRVRPGVAYRWLEGDLRNVVRGLKDRELSVWEAGRALRPIRRTVHADVSLCDPLPSAARLAYAARTLLRS